MCRAARRTDVGRPVSALPVVCVRVCVRACVCVCECVRVYMYARPRRGRRKKNTCEEEDTCVCTLGHAGGAQKHPCVRNTRVFPPSVHLVRMHA
jgi:hypothetical protein